MKPDDRAAKARLYLETLCSVKPNRRTGSLGNQEATGFVADTIRPYGYEMDVTPFPAVDHICGGAVLTHGDGAFQVQVSPYSLGCDVLAELVAVSTVEELASTNCEGKILLMRGAMTSEQLMPKNFVFYNPEHHQTIITLLESRKPAAIIAATGRQPDMVGALYPFPLIVDGDFDIPSVYCRDTVGDALAERHGEPFRLEIDASRLPSSASNVIARLNGSASRKVVLTAHIDAYEDSPGALDNASGVVVLCLCAELLSDYRGEYCVEIAVLNGEDHYSAGGEMDYLKRYGSELPSILFVVNIDDAGYKQGKSSYAFHECSPQLERKAEDVFGRFDGLGRGEQWFQGDHMIFVQSGIPAVTFTSEDMPELMKTVTHTSADTPNIVDCHKLVEIAESLNALVRSL